MREVARGLSGMFMASIPASLNLRAASTAADGSLPLGGTISTSSTKAPSEIFLARRDFSPRGTISGRVTPLS